jgi:hypothetical protein
MSQQVIDGPEARGEDGTEKLTPAHSQLDEAISNNEDLGNDQHRPTVSDMGSESETDDDTELLAEKDDDSRRDADGNGVYPAVWTPQQADEFKSSNPWLFYLNGHLGCKTCSKVASYGAFKEQGLKVSKNWANGTIEFNGKKRSSQLSSLRKKIFEHAGENRT